MTLAKRLFTSLAAVATLLSFGSLGCNPGQAAIVKGSVTGIWDRNFIQGGDVNVGDLYTATYSYDDALLTPYSTSIPGVAQYSGLYGSLLSLVVSSGSYSHTFDFSNGSGEVRFEDYIGDPSFYNTSYISKFFGVLGLDNTAQGYNFFRAYNQSEEFGSLPGIPFNREYARLYTRDSQGNDTNVVDAFNARFTSDSTAIPTPALLPGLIGLGLGVLRKRKAEAAKQTVEV